MKVFISVSLLIASLILASILLPIGFVIAIIYSIFKGHGEDFLYRVAISIDQLGNTVCAQLFDWALIKNAHNKFGNEDETISSVLGKNKRDGTLTGAGKCLCALLDAIQMNHVENAIDN